MVLPGRCRAEILRADVALERGGRKVAAAGTRGAPRVALGAGRFGRLAGSGAYSAYTKGVRSGECGTSCGALWTAGERIRRARFSRTRGHVCRTGGAVGERCRMQGGWRRRPARDISARVARARPRAPANSFQRTACSAKRRAPSAASVGRAACRASREPRGARAGGRGARSGWGTPAATGAGGILSGPSRMGGAEAGGGMPPFARGGGACAGRCEGGGCCCAAFEAGGGCCVARPCTAVAAPE